MSKESYNNYTLEQKIGQMVLAGFRGASINSNSKIVEDIFHHYLGSVWLTEKEKPAGERISNIESPNQLKQLTDSLQNFSNNSLLISIDAEGGEVNRLKKKYGFSDFPSAQYLGDLNDLSQTHLNADKIASLLQSCGININFAPVVDLSINPNCPVIAKKGRSFSNDPEKVALHAREFILAHREKNIANCLKHFPGHGSSESDTHDGFVDVSDSWSEKELIPYQLLIKENLVDSIMTSHVFNKNLDEKYPATLSKKIITGILREKMQFDGVIFTDDLIMRAIEEHYSLEDAIELTINAGVDVIIQGNAAKYNPDIVAITVNTIKRLIEKGKVKEERINESFNRIITLKKKLNLKM
jgi:beta-N-acetylhexosaminidase